MSKKILSAEDSPATQKFISFTLKYKGYEVTTANDGIEALEKLPEENFDLIILDIMMLCPYAHNRQDYSLWILNIA